MRVINGPAFTLLGSPGSAPTDALTARGWKKAALGSTDEECVESGRLETPNPVRAIVETPRSPAPAPLPSMELERRALSPPRFLSLVPSWLLVDDWRACCPPSFASTTCSSTAGTVVEEGRADGVGWSRGGVEWVVMASTSTGKTSQLGDSSPSRGEHSLIAVALPRGRDVVVQVKAVSGVAHSQLRRALPPTPRLVQRRLPAARVPVGLELRMAAPRAVRRVPPSP